MRAPTPGGIRTRDAETEEFLNALVVQDRERMLEVPQGSNFWRAQLGHGQRPHYEGDEYYVVPLARVCGEALPEHPARLPGVVAEERGHVTDPFP